MTIKIESQIIRTNDQLKSMTKTQINQILIFMHHQLVQSLKDVESLILNNPFGLSKEEVREHYGEDIAELDLVGEKVAELIAMVELD